MEKGSCDIGLIGLAVMGQNLALNMNDHGYRVAVFNRTVSKVDDFIRNEAAGTEVVGTVLFELHSYAAPAQSAALASWMAAIALGAFALQQPVGQHLRE